MPPLSRILTRFYPEAKLGGFARNEHRVIFYTRVNALLNQDMVVLDYGAGRGKWPEFEEGYQLALTTLKGKCRKVIGVDVDPVVSGNPLVDEGIPIELDGRLPFADESIDMIVSWAVFEHVTNPKAVAAELNRVLKPGGYICCWTPNRWSYFAIAAQLVPSSLHARVLQRVQPGGRAEKDVFPTAYRLNTKAAIRRWFPDRQFENYSYIFSGPPSYHGERLPLALLWAAWNWLLPSSFGQTMHIFLRKRAAP